MTIHQQPHYRVQAGVLADWLDQQPPTSWWSVDGDPILMGRVHFPCSSNELAAELRRMNRPLLLLALDTHKAEADGREIVAGDLDALALVDLDLDTNRVFQFCWDGIEPEIPWLLVEDVEIGKLALSSGIS